MKGYPGRGRSLGSTNHSGRPPCLIRVLRVGAGPCVRVAVSGCGGDGRRSSWSLPRGARLASDRQRREAATGSSVELNRQSAAEPADELGVGRVPARRCVAAFSRLSRSAGALDHILDQWTGGGWCRAAGRPPRPGAARRLGFARPPASRTRHAARCWRRRCDFGEEGREPCRSAGGGPRPAGCVGRIRGRVTTQRLAESTNGVDQIGVSVGGDKLHAGQTAIDQPA